MENKALIKKQKLGNPFISLKNHNFRYYLIGSGISQTGT